jgi:hypothetical protein
MLTGRLALTAQGVVCYTSKTPYRDGTTQVMCERSPAERHRAV